MSKRISAVFFLTCIFSVFAAIAGSFLTEGAELHLSVNNIVSGKVSQGINTFVQQHFPGGEELKQLYIKLNKISGVVKIDDVFIGKTMLMKDLTEPNTEYVDTNTNAILQFAKSAELPSYLMIIPTACAIKQQELPDYVNLFNQRGFIEKTYKEMGKGVSVVDTYLKLLTNKEDYIYYRTHDNLTAKGGYIIYSALANRLGITPIRELSQFDIFYGKNDFYGDIYKEVPYEEIQPDRVYMYHFQKYKREYRVTHRSLGGTKTYYTLYPEFTAELTGKNETVLGGMSPIIDIKTTTTSDSRLIIFADETVLSYIPFLLVHYGEVTIVDIENIPPEMLESIEIKSYDQALFGVSIDTFIHTDAFAKLTSVAENTTD